ncbi:MAG TPA: calcium-binding protein [Bryobacteraceae bacterium]|nr:calcium-binding protein [Bryobacteraceae bacterium]
MKRPKRDPVREDRIHNEAIVDASPEEQAMSWYYYLDGKISFPFRAKCLAANAISPLRKGEAVEVLRMAVEDLCEHDMLVQIRWQGRKMAVPLSQLGAIDPDESTKEAIGDWHTGLPRATACNLRTATESSRHTLLALSWRTSNRCATYSRMCSGPS